MGIGIDINLNDRIELEEKLNIAPPEDPTFSFQTTSANKLNIFSEPFENFCKKS